MNVSTSMISQVLSINHIHSKGTWMPSCQQSSIKYLIKSHTSWGHMDASTSTEFYQIFNKITYLLRTHMNTSTSAEFYQILNKITYRLKAHQCLQISRVLWNTWQNHILPENTSMPLHQQNSIKYLTKSHTLWVYINASISAEFHQILDKITYSLRAHQCLHIRNVLSNTWQNHILSEGMNASTSAS
jgi:hypothetical protein